ncbi:hypothetical protein BG910_04825 [Neisseria chenwenguii]|uniref:Uncharacterized protein n=1 Tax=Neisseria chenwenguii TaxID=1853278 RepID=A0A220S167_9NEIS|nr:hypothetical protein BG910_04825 [Neisseria chenwenguii]
MGRANIKQDKYNKKCSYAIFSALKFTQIYLVFLTGKLSMDISHLDMELLFLYLLKQLHSAVNHNAIYAQNARYGFF